MTYEIIPSSPNQSLDGPIAATAPPIDHEQGVSLKPGLDPRLTAIAETAVATTTIAEGSFLISPNDTRSAPELHEDPSLTEKAQSSPVATDLAPSDSFSLHPAPIAAPSIQHEVAPPEAPKPTALSSGSGSSPVSSPNQLPDNPIAATAPPIDHEQHVLPAPSVNSHDTELAKAGSTDQSSMTTRPAQAASRLPDDARPANARPQSAPERQQTDNQQPQGPIISPGRPSTDTNPEVATPALSRDEPADRPVLQTGGAGHGSGTSNLDRLRSGDGEHEDKDPGAVYIQADTRPLDELKAKGNERPGFTERQENSLASAPVQAMQVAIMKSAFSEGVAHIPEIRPTIGRFYGHFARVLQRTDEELHAINKDFTADYLMPPDYTPEEVQQVIADLEEETRDRLKFVKNYKIQQIEDLVSAVLLPTMKLDTIEPGLLDTPPYTQQGMFRQDCAGACFRMIFADIAGWMPSKGSVATAVGHNTVPDDIYSGALLSEAMRDLTGKQTSVIDMVGGSLAGIGKIVSSYKRRRPEGAAYAVTSYRSELRSDEVWHEMVLLSVDNREVICHDPSATGRGRPFRHIPKKQFIERWAPTLNRARIILAD
jgi:hypothetical protein